MSAMSLSSKRNSRFRSKNALMPELMDEDGGGAGGAAKKRPRAPKNRATKVSVEFDPEKRRQFLTGFRRRKEERRKRAREQIDRDAKEELRRAREDAKKRALEMKAMQSGSGTSSSHRVVPEIEHLLPTLEREEEAEAAPDEVRDLGSHTVSVTHLGDLAAASRGRIARPEPQDGDEQEEADPDSATADQGAAEASKRNQRVANRLMHKKLQKSKAFRKAQKLKGQADNKRAKKKRMKLSKRAKASAKNKRPKQ